MEYELTTGGARSTTKRTYSGPGAPVLHDTRGVVSDGLSDHLGSAGVTLDASGNGVGERRYCAYASTRLTTAATPTAKRSPRQRQPSGPARRLELLCSRMVC